MLRGKPVLLRLAFILLLAVSFAWFTTPVAQANTIVLPPGFSESLVATGLGSVTAMEFAPDGRLFVLVQGGQVRVIKNGALLPTPFLTMTVDSVGERGLLGIAFDPNFTSNRYVYLYHTVPAVPSVSSPFNRITRFTASVANPDVADAGPGTIILSLDPLTSATNHNGGAIHFGPDGKLYVAVGDNATSVNAQTLANRHGKMLRLNADGTIPADNPFNATATGANQAIWALGLRNPFTFDFERGTGRLFINDVGAGTWEEVNEGGAGRNFGWPRVEGPGTPSPAITIGTYQAPLHAYQHIFSPFVLCAITGGVFHNPVNVQFPSSVVGVGEYFYADYCANRLYIVNPTTGAGREFASGVVGNPIDLKMGTDGSLYYAARGESGVVKRIQYAPGNPPTIVQSPENVTRGVGQNAPFSCSAAGPTPITYQWQRNQTDIPSATGNTYTLNNVQAGDNGAKFRCVATNPFGSANSTEATLTVTVNQIPEATILTPTSGTLYKGGDTINYSGSATDTEDGTLTGSAFTWEVVFHHDDHTHPFIPATTGATSGSFFIPTMGETSANVWYRIHLTVRDSAGAEFSVFRDINPRTATIMLRTDPPLFQNTLDGQPVLHGTNVVGVVGIQRSIGAISPQTRAGTTFVFNRWLHGGPITQTISTPLTNTVYVSEYRISSAPAETIGVQRPSLGVFLMRNTNTSGGPNKTLTFGLPTDLPITGDWNGDGVETPGVFRPTTGEFFLSNSTASPAVVSHYLVFGIPGDQPLAGDWNGDGKDTVGVFRASTGQFFLRDALTGTVANYQMVFGGAGDIGLVGDWNGDAKDSPAVYRPSEAVFYLTNRLCASCAVFADFRAGFGVVGDSPFAGDWNGDGKSGVGVFRASNGATYLRNNATTTGIADITLTFAGPGDKLLGGNWQAVGGGGASTIPEVAPTFAP
jgi:glucose/arabinose dehydrogenase